MEMLTFGKSVRNDWISVQGHYKCDEDKALIFFLNILTGKNISKPKYVTFLIMKF